MTGRDLEKFLEKSTTSSSGEEKQPRKKGATLERKLAAPSRINSKLHKSAQTDQQNRSTLPEFRIRIANVLENIQDASCTLDRARTLALLRSFIDNTIDTIWSVDPERFSLLTWNRSLEELVRKGHGITLRVGMGREELWPSGSEFIEKWNGFYRRALREGPYATEYTVASGSRVLELNFNVVQQDNRVFAISVFGKDITEKKKMEKALQQSEERFRMIFMSSPAALSIYEREGANRLVDVNPAWERATGYQRHEVTGLAPGDMELLSDFGAQEEAVRRIEAEGGFRDITTAYRTKNGDNRIGLMSGEGLELDGRQCVLIASLDITDLKRAKDALQNKSRDLAEANIALNVLLNRRDEEREALGDSIVANVKELVRPHLKRLRATYLSDDQAALLDLVDSNLEDIISPFVQKMMTAYAALTPTEIQVANLIKDGKRSKEIARLLNVSMGTVDTHRNNIRKKLGIGGKKLNLHAHLLSL